MPHLSADEESIRFLVTSVSHHIDHKRWDALRSLFSAEVETDYVSLFGGAPAKQTSEALVAGWRTALKSVATQHLLGPIEVGHSGASAAAFCHVRAMHFAAGAKGGEHWEVLGHYVFRLAEEAKGWKITGMKLETFLQTGNRNLLAEAPGKGG